MKWTALQEDQRPPRCGLAWVSMALPQYPGGARHPRPRVSFCLLTTCRGQVRTGRHSVCWQRPQHETPTLQKPPQAPPGHPLRRKPLPCAPWPGRLASPLLNSSSVGLCSTGPGVLGSGVIWGTALGSCEWRCRWTHCLVGGQLYPSCPAVCTVYVPTCECPDTWVTGLWWPWAWRVVGGSTGHWGGHHPVCPSPVLPARAAQLTCRIEDPK